MANFLQESSGGTFHASDLANWFHSAPHKDLQLEDTTTIFSPAEETYREALYVLAVCIASFGFLLFLVLLIFYSCCYCIICRQKKERHHNESCGCSKSCLQMQVFIIALVCCGALVGGFVYNGKTSDGVDKFRNSVDDIQSNINYASKLGKKMTENLQQIQEDINELADESRSQSASQAGNKLLKVISSLHAVNRLLPEDLVNKSSDVGDKVHRYDNYRWLTTVILLSWCIFLCVFLFWTGCQVNSCILVMATVFCLMTVLFTWAVTGAHFAVATGIGDFCVHPKQAIEKGEPDIRVVISYYMDCNVEYNPFSKNLSELGDDLTDVINLINKVPDSPAYRDLLDKTKAELYMFNNNLALYNASFACDKIHEEYMDAMDGLCEKTLNSLAIVILALFVIAFFSGLLTCCVCPLWNHRRPNPTTYNPVRVTLIGPVLLQGISGLPGENPWCLVESNSAEVKVACTNHCTTDNYSCSIGNITRGNYSDIRNSPDDVGNSVLWWPHDVDAESNQSFYQRHAYPTEQSPLIVNQHPPNYETEGQRNANVIHVDYHPEPIRRDEHQSSIRHSF